jgi:hypothetical protein
MSLFNRQWQTPGEIYEHPDLQPFLSALRPRLGQYIITFLMLSYL